MMHVGIPVELSVELSSFTVSSRRIETALGSKRTTPEALELVWRQLIDNREQNRLLQIQVGRQLSAAKAAARELVS